MKTSRMTTLAAVVAAALCASRPALAATDATSLIDKDGSAAAILPSLADVASLVEEVRDLSAKYSALTSAVAFIEKKCETDSAWRRAYHQGVATQTVATNEYGIAYRVTIYGDGYVYADAPRVVPRPVSPEDAAKSEAERKALIAAKAEEARQAMERAALPAKVAEILEARRAAAVTNVVTVTVEANR